MASSESSLIGAHAFIWSPAWDHAGARHAATQAAGAGFDFIEIPVLDVSAIDIADTVGLLDSVGLGCTCSVALPVGTHLPSAPEKALAYLRNAIDVAAELGSQWLTGALYGSLGTHTGSGPTEEELDTVARTLQKVAAHAAKRDVSLGLEIINRYETYILNTAEQAAVLIERIDAPNVYAHLDTYHMNIEEPSLTDAITRLGRRLGYLHLAESNRGLLGEGNVPFPEIFEALTTIGYGGPLVIEAFLSADPAIRSVTATWQDYRLDPQDFAVKGHDYVKGLSEARVMRASQIANPARQGGLKPV